MGFFDFLKSKSKPEQIIDKYYKNYPRKPYISPDRDFDDWEMRVSTFPNMIVQREMMIPYDDGLLPGHVYMLYWIDKIHRQRVPEYFEYEYGIDFAAEKMFLRHEGYLEDDTLTDKGRQAIEIHYDVILAKHPEPTTTETVKFNTKKSKTRVIPQIDRNYDTTIPEEDYDQLKAELQYINRILKIVSEKYNLPNLSIQFRLLNFGIGNYGTHYIYTPYTKTGRQSKYPMEIRYSYKERKSDIPAVFGNISYLKDGSIGVADMIFWIKKEGYFITLGLFDGELSVKKIEHSIPLEGKRILIYKR